MKKYSLRSHLFGLLERLDALIKIIGDKIVIPGFGGFSLYYIGKFFVNGLMKGSFTIRAKSVTYSLFSAIFPLLIFGFSIIPFIPIPGFQESLLSSHPTPHHSFPPSSSSASIFKKTLCRSFIPQLANINIKKWIVSRANVVFIREYY